ncbi:hypothetical protein CW304_22445 [Bacillus sp. UFRGS-B20]|nr:hypothetical protein CW304_22445 [Bacillus sp. UFRGS-B20]
MSFVGNPDLKTQLQHYSTYSCGNRYSILISSASISQIGAKIVWYNPGPFWKQGSVVSKFVGKMLGLHQHLLSILSATSLDCLFNKKSPYFNE